MQEPLLQRPGLEISNGEDLNHKGSQKPHPVDRHNSVDAINYGIVNLAKEIEMKRGVVEATTKYQAQQRQYAQYIKPPQV